MTPGMTPEEARRLYRRLPGWARAALPLRLEAWARARFHPGAPAAAAGLEDRLWGGFSQAALRDLAALARTAAPREAAEAAWVLARWRAVEEDFAAALAEIERMRALHPPAGADPRQFALEAFFLCRLGRGAEARALLDARAGRGFDASLALLRANSWRPAAGAPDTPESEARALAAINAVYRRFGLQEIARRDPGRPLALDNLAGVDPGPKPGARRRVSVLLPAFDAEATLATALRALAEQTHADLEVLVVDDASHRRHRRPRRRLRPRRPALPADPPGREPRRLRRAQPRARRGDRRARHRARRRRLVASRKDRAAGAPPRPHRRALELHRLGAGDPRPDLPRRRPGLSGPDRR